MGCSMESSRVSEKQDDLVLLIPICVEWLPLCLCARGENMAEIGFGRIHDCVWVRNTGNVVGAD